MTLKIGTIAIDTASTERVVVFLHPLIPEYVYVMYLSDGRKSLVSVGDLIPEDPGETTPDAAAVGFTFQGRDLCRYCAHDVLEEIVIENAYRLPSGVSGLGILGLMRVCSEFIDTSLVVPGTRTYNDPGYDSDDYPKPFRYRESDALCQNEECELDLYRVYRRCLLSGI